MAPLLCSIISSKRQFIPSYLSEQGEFSQTVITCFIFIVEAEPWGMVICKDTSDSSCQTKWSFFIDSQRLKQTIKHKPGENLRQSTTCGALHFKEHRFFCRLHRMHPLISHWRNICKLTRVPRVALLRIIILLTIQMCCVIAQGRTKTATKWLNDKKKESSLFPLDCW